jgi:hypothetical protein
MVVPTPGAATGDGAVGFPCKVSLAERRLFGEKALILRRRCPAARLPALPEDGGELPSSAMSRPRHNLHLVAGTAAPRCLDT